MAAWKPKEKALTAEEAVELARKELAPLWLNTPPLIAGVRDVNQKCAAHPLEKALDKGSWLLLFIDVTTFAGKAALKYTHEWIRRYSAFDVNFLAVIKPTYTCFALANHVESSLGHVNSSGASKIAAFPIVLDRDGMIAEAFGVSAASMPATKLLSQRKSVFDHSGADWARSTEEHLQRFLRIKDPGLALSPPFELTTGLPTDAGSAEFAHVNRSPLLKIAGPHTNDADRVIIRHPATSVTFVSPNPRVSIFAQTLGGLPDPSRVKVELGHETVFEAAAAPDLTYGEDGSASIKVTEPRLYEAVQGLPTKSREITLRFPDSDRIPVALYSIRFSP